MKFLAIDSSLAHTGVAAGFIENDRVHVTQIYLHETEKTKHKQVRASSDTIVRCRSTYTFLKHLIADYKPDVIFVETPSGSQSANGMKSYGATCQLIAILNPIPIEVNPMEVKLAGTGSKTGSKRDIIDWAYEKYPNLNWKFHAGKLQDKNEHMADAIAIAFAAMNTPEYNRIKNFR